ISLDFERGDVVPERHLERLIGPEHKVADARMQPIGPNHKIKLTWRGMIETNPRTPTYLFDTRDRVAKDGLHLPVQRGVTCICQIGAPQGRQAPLDQVVKPFGRETTARAATPVYEAGLRSLLAQLLEPGDQAHLLGNVIPNAPKVDDVSAGA